MNILVFGGSEFDPLLIGDCLTMLSYHMPITKIIACDESLTDMAAIEWAKQQEIAFQQFMPDLEASKANHGYTHFVRCIQEGEPDHALGFPGGEGTGVMARNARFAGVPVTLVTINELNQFTFVPYKR